MCPVRTLPNPYTTLRLCSSMKNLAVLLTLASCVVAQQPPLSPGPLSPDPRNNFNDAFFSNNPPIRPGPPIGDNNLPYDNNPTFVPRPDNPNPRYEMGRNDGWDQELWTKNLGENTIIKEATYFVVASRMVRPGQVYTVAATVLHAPNPLTIRASISRNRVELSTDSKDVKEGIPEKLIMKVPPTSVPGEYKLRVEGLYNGVLGGSAFVNETKLTFSQRSLTIFVQTDKPVYMQGQTVRFRAIPINTELKAFDSTIDVYMLDPHRRIMKRWLSRQSNVGTVSLDYYLSDQPVFGMWTIQVLAQGQVEEQTFHVEEYYQTRFEVNVTMPAFFFDTDKYIYGTVMANYTSGAPVSGNLTLKATFRPTDPYALGRPVNLPTVYFNFDEEYPFWYPKKHYQSRGAYHLKFFRGVYDFKYPMQELRQMLRVLDGYEMTITATVGERFLDDIVEGYSVARIFNSTIRAHFLGGSPQVFKPSMPFNTYVAVSHQDGSQLSPSRLLNSDIKVSCTYIRATGETGRIHEQAIPLLKVNDGVWQLKIDLRSQLGLYNVKSAEQELALVKEVNVDVSIISHGQRAQTQLRLLAHYSPVNHHLKVSTSSLHAKVGEYIVLRVESNFYAERFHYMVMAKGIILVTGEEVLQNSVRSLAIPLSAEMAPAATVIVYHVGQYGEVVGDSITIPVNGVSRNKFKVFINNRKYRTGERVEIAIYGDPGSYVGLSGLDRAFYSMQAGNELSYAKVIQKMSSFDEQTNGTHLHTWFSHEGLPDDIVYYPSSSYGIDVNRTFEYAGLVVFTDVPLPRRRSFCNASLGFAECYDGSCYHFSQRCDGIRNCQDGTDEAPCPRYNMTDLSHYRKYRFSRIQRQYDNVWLWSDINIGPHGRYIFDVEVPHTPVHWMVSAFGMSPKYGFGMLQKPIEYVGVLPFYINVEMPNSCRQGEQVGIRVSVFNYMLKHLEATVILAGSKDYKFVHVEKNGIVRSYNPRTSFGEHQFFVFIPAQDATVVYMPIVPNRLGDIEVTIMATSLIGKDTITRRLHVEADGLPQYRHQSIVLDLSNRPFAMQYMHLNITEFPIIPYEEERYYIYGSNKATISVVGDVVGPIFPTMPLNATSLLNLPMDCAEQTAFSFAAHLYTNLYMRYTNQRNRTLEKQSFHYMNILYQRTLSFVKWDGSFSPFRTDWNQSESSVWLTSYCVRILQEASFYEWENYIYIDPEVISRAVSWLLKHQSPEGAFYEISWIPDRKMNDSLPWTEDNRSRNITLTAQVLITLDTVKDITGGLGSQLALAQRRAISWLEKNLDNLRLYGSPYDVAVVAYALMQSKATIAEAAYRILATHRREIGGLWYWGRAPIPAQPTKLENQKPFLLPRLPYEYDASNIETTAYALQVYVAKQEQFTEKIVLWLNSQRLTDGGWASTQDTAVAMKALIEYTNRNRLRDVSGMRVRVEATALPGKVKTLTVDHNKLARLQKLEIPEAWGTVKIQANGAGYAILQLSVQYNVDVVAFQTAPPVRAFHLKTDAIFHGRNQSHITYTSCQRWTNLAESQRSGMAVLDVAIPTGYIIQQQKLDWYIQTRRVRNLQRARYTEKRVLFYFDYLDAYDTCLNFTIERWYPVANMSRYLPIRVYDYYAPERFNETIFNAYTTYILNICEVCGSSQCPYCPIFNIASMIDSPITLTFFVAVFVAVVHNMRFQIWGFTIK